MRLQRPTALLAVSSFAASALLAGLQGCELTVPPLPDGGSNVVPGTDGSVDPGTDGGQLEADVVVEAGEGGDGGPLTCGTLEALGDIIAPRISKEEAPTATGGAPQGIYDLVDMVFYAGPSSPYDAGPFPGAPAIRMALDFKANNQVEWATSSAAGEGKINSGTYTLDPATKKGDLVLPCPPGPGGRVTTLSFSGYSANATSFVGCNVDSPPLVACYILEKRVTSADAGDGG